MKTYIKQNRQSIVPEGGQLGAIGEKMLGIRSAFLDHLDTLSAPVADPIKRHYLDRLVRADDRHMLGEYTPFLLADLIGIPDHLAMCVAVPWMVLYEHALLIDDFVDVKEKSWAEEILLSQILFDDFVSLWREPFLAHPDLWQAFCGYHKQGVSAALEELNQISYQDRVPLSDTNLDDHIHLTMGRKAALVKFCAAALSCEHRGRLLSRAEENAIDRLCAGIQLLDDLSDCAEDYRARRDTFPLRAAFQRIGRSDLSLAGRAALTDDEIIFILILSGATTRISKLVCHYLTTGLTTLGVVPDSETRAYLLSLVEASSRAATKIEELLEQSPQPIEMMLLSFRKGTDQWMRLLTDRAYGDLWADMKSQFKSIPRASN